MVRKYLLIIGCVLGLFTFNSYSQATTTLSIDSFNIINSGNFGDTASVEVRVRVLNGLIPDTLVGDIYYYYLTDSMVSPQIIELEGNIETIDDQFLDTIGIPINVGEMKTGPLNLIVVWPAMMDPAVLDTDSVVFNLVIGFLGIEPEYSKINENIIYPSPAMQYLYIKPEEIHFIREMQILNMHGQIIKTISGENLSNGLINIDQLDTGFYIISLQYKDGSLIHKKILKE